MLRIQIHCIYIPKFGLDERGERLKKGLKEEEKVTGGGEVGKGVRRRGERLGMGRQQGRREMLEEAGGRRTEWM
jgi:hypothetical protein